MGYRTLAAVALVVLGATGCFKHDYRDYRYEPGERKLQWTGHFLWGLAGREVVDVKAWCDGEPAYEVGTGANGGTWFVTLITLGIYSPKIVWVRCSAGPAEQTAVRLDAAGTPVEVVRVEGEHRYRGVPRLTDPTTGEWAVVATEETP